MIFSHLWFIKFLNAKLWIRRQINIVKFKSDTQADSDQHTKFQFLQLYLIKRWSEAESFTIFEKFTTPIIRLL